LDGGAVFGLITGARNEFGLVWQDRIMIWWSLLQLKSESPDTRRRAVEKLGADGGVRARAALAAALADPSSAVRWQAAKALESLKWEPTNNAQRAWLAVARSDLARAASHGPDAVEPLTLVLRTGAYHERHAAVQALSWIADERVQPALQVALKDKDDQVRCAAAAALRNLGGPGAIAPLIAALTDVHQRVRAAAAEALGLLGAPEAFEPLIPLVNDQQWEVRQAAALALGKFHDRRAVEPVMALLKDGDREVREAAVRALGEIGDSRAIGPLILVLKDEQDAMRSLAYAALQNVDPRWEQTEAAQVAASHLKSGLTHTEYWVRQSAADALARIGGIHTAEAGVRKPDEPATAVFSRPRRQAAMDVIVPLLGDFDRELRLAAVEALGRFGQFSATELLTRALNDNDAGVRAAAAHALELLRSKPTGEKRLTAHGEMFPI
jgi:HEAT repeat protein